MITILESTTAKMSPATPGHFRPFYPTKLAIKDEECANTGKERMIHLAQGDHDTAGKMARRAYPPKA